MIRICERLSSAPESAADRPGVIVVFAAYEYFDLAGRGVRRASALVHESSDSGRRASILGPSSPRRPRRVEKEVESASPVQDEVPRRKLDKLRPFPRRTRQHHALVLSRRDRLPFPSAVR